MSLNPSGVPIINVNTKKTTISALLDTGATYSLVDLKLAKLLKPDFKRNEGEPLVCANGTTCKPLGKINLQLKIGVKEINHDLLVMGNLPIRCFIGADIIKQHDIVIQLKDDKFWFGSEPKYCFPINGIVNKKGKVNLTIGTDPEDALGKVQQNVKKILENFPTVARKDGGYGRTNLTYHVIDAYGPPVKCPVRRVTPALRKVIRTQVEHLLEKGMIRPSKSPYAAPVVLDMKKNGEYRMCFDYTRLNAQTKDNASPMESTSGILRSIPLGYYYTVIDLKSGYWQVMLDGESIYKAAFITPDGLFEPLVMVFGLKNAPKTFTALMNRVLEGYMDEFVKCFLDDILIYSRTLEEHFHHLELVFARLKDAGLTINLDKCSFANREVEYLGHVIGRNGITRKPETVRAVMEFPVPTQQRDVQSFLGLCLWYSYFIEHFATIAAPLYALTSKNVKFHWNKEHQQAFEKLKKVMCEEVTLFGIDYDFPIIMKCDSSDIGIGGCLVQVIDGRERPIAFVSKLLKKSERNAHIYEKEAYAIIFCYQKFRQFIEGHKFTIVTDNRAVNYIKHMKERKPKIMRWAIEISSWNADIVLRPGKENYEADALSRSPLVPLPGDINLFEESEDHVYAPVASLFGDIITREEIINEQKIDEDCKKISEEIKEKRNSDFKIIDGMLKRRMTWRIRVDELQVVEQTDSEEVTGPSIIGLVGVTYEFDPHAGVSDTRVTAQLTGVAKALPSKNDMSSVSLELATPAAMMLNSKKKYIQKNIKTDPQATKTISMDSFAADKDSKKINNKELLKKVQTRTYYVPVLPLSLRERVLKMFHDVPQSGHLNARPTSRKIKDRFYWYKMDSDIRKYCKECWVCQQSKSRNALPYGLMQSSDIPSHVFEVIHVDFCGPFPKTGGGRLNEYC